MVIGKGTPYGHETDVDPAWPSFDADTDLAVHIDRSGGDPCILRGGDLFKTLGGGAPAGVAPLAYPVDLLEVDLDGRRFVAVAHLVARRSLWSGRFFVAMNAAYVDGMYLGPKSHPNDGLVDTTLGALDLQQRVLARRRAMTGTHLPHPKLSASRKKSVSARFDRSVPVRLDGVKVARAHEIALTVLPDAGLVVPVS